MSILAMLRNVPKVIIPIMADDQVSFCKPTDFIPWPDEAPPRFRELIITLKAKLDDARNEARLVFIYGGFTSTTWTVSYRALCDTEALIGIGMRAVRESMYNDTALNLRNRS